MMEETALSIVVEPPLNVVNSLLDVARRIAAHLQEEEGEASWFRPEHYGAEILRFLGNGDGIQVSMETGLRKAAKQVREFGIKLAAPSLEETEDGGVLVVSKLTSTADEVSAMVETVRRELEDTGLEPTGECGFHIPVARVGGESMIQALREALEGRDAPVANWVLGGLSLARVEDRPPDVYGCHRIGFIPLARGGSRRR